jgi:hypothetical protein
MNILVPVATQAPAADTDAKVTITPPEAELGVYLHSIRWSTGGTGSFPGGTLTISWTDPVAGALTETHYITNTGPGNMVYGGNSQFPKNVAVTFKIAAIVGYSASVYPNAEFR